MWLECEDIDPTSGSVAADFDLSFDEQTERHQPARRVRRATGMDLVCRRANDVRGLRSHPIPDAKRDEEAIDDAHPEIRNRATLNSRDPRLRHAGATGQFTLAPTQIDSDVMDHPADVLEDS
jgi:hypothetical protein